MSDFDAIKIQLAEIVKRQTAYMEEYCSVTCSEARRALIHAEVTALERKRLKLLGPYQMTATDKVMKHQLIRAGLWRVEHD